jgi:hypothetical protein
MFYFNLTKKYNDFPIFFSIYTMNNILIYNYLLNYSYTLPSIIYNIYFISYYKYFYNYSLNYITIPSFKIHSITFIQ